MENKLQFGTDGIRGQADQFPFTPKALQKLGCAIAKWGVGRYRKEKLKIIIGHDTRISCDEIKKNLISGLQATDTKVIDAGIIPTPAVLQIMQHQKNFDFGIVISASHNKYTDNGIKLFDAKTGKLTAQDEKSIVSFFEASEEKVFGVSDAQGDKSISESYKKIIIKKFQPNFLLNKKIVLDCANGATYKVGPEIFAQLGATVISLSTNPDGKNINENCGALHPEVLAKEIIKNNADIGFAFDGDGDRVISVNKNGEIKDGDDMLAILLEHPDFKDQQEIVGTVMTNYGLEKFLKKKNKKLTRTKVGDKHVAANLEKNNLLLGGETSGHIIIRNYLNTGDGIFVALKVLESIIKNKNWDMKTFNKTPQFILNVPVTKKENLDQDPYKSTINDHKNKLTDGRIIVRYSGTENLLRIMVEDKTIELAKEIAHSLGEKLWKTKTSF